MTVTQGFLPRFPIYPSIALSSPTEVPSMSKRLLRLKPTIRNAINCLISLTIRVQKFAVFSLTLSAQKIAT
mgnify:FL=1